MPKITILHADDDALGALVLERVLEGLEPPVQVQNVSSGAEAIAYLTGSAGYSDRSLHPVPELILADIQMPGLTGFDLLSFVRRTEQYRNLPVFILTSSENPTDRALAKELGATGYIVKGAAFQTVKAVLADVLKRPLKSTGAEVG